MATEPEVHNGVAGTIDRVRRVLSPTTQPWVVEVAGRHLDVGPEPVVIGRDDLPGSPGTVSRRHVEIALVDGAPSVTDLGTTNGTTIERHGQRIALSPSTPTWLMPGDRLTVGPHVVLADLTDRSNHP